MGGRGNWQLPWHPTVKAATTEAQHPGVLHPGTGFRAWGHHVLGEVSKSRFPISSCLRIRELRAFSLGDNQRCPRSPPPLQTRDLAPNPQPGVPTGNWVFREAAKQLNLEGLYHYHHASGPPAPRQDTPTPTLKPPVFNPQPLHPHPTPQCCPGLSHPLYPLSAWHAPCWPRLSQSHSPSPSPPVFPPPPQGMPIWRATLI